MSPTFEYCTLKLLNMYIKEEKAFLDILSPNLNSHVEAIKVNTLYKISILYSVHRFKGFKKEKMKTLFSAYNKVELINNNPADVVNSFSKDIANVFETERSFISMSSKLLWFKFKSPVIIYDTRAKKAIKYKSDNYAEYIKEWEKQYLKKQAQIKTACNNVAKLDKSFFYSGFNRKILQEKWFHERVFDIYLWEIGG